MRKYHDDGNGISDLDRGHAPQRPKRQTRANDRLVISAMIGPAFVKPIFLNCGCSVNINFKKAYDQRKVEAKVLKPTKARIYGFGEKGTEAVGYVELLVELGDGKRSRIRMILFIVMDIDPPYNAFIGRPAVAVLRATLAS